MKTHKCSIPENSLANAFMPGDYSDAFTCQTLAGSFTADDIQVIFWTSVPGWVGALMKLRDALVRPFGLKGGNGDRGSLEKCIREGVDYRFGSVPARSDDETVLLLSDRHLDAYLTVMTVRGGGVTKVVSGTIVHYKNSFGRFYFFCIRPFHSLVVRRMLSRAVKIASQPAAAQGK